jgi:SAM-dependent methyltransferase
MRKDIYKDLDTYENTHWWHTYKRDVLVTIFDKYFPKRKLSILDAGCGVGGTLKLLQKYGEAIGIDPDDDALAYCRKIGLRKVFKKDVESLSYTKKFDVITLFEVLEHVDEHKCLTKLSRAIKDNGIMLVSVPAYQWMWSNWDTIIHHKKRYTTKSLEMALSRHGFKTERITYLFSFLVVPVFIFRKLKDIIYKSNYPSDLRVGTSPLVNIFMKIFTATEFLVFKFANIPFGLSIICVARKRTN